jgi:protein-arginine kinase activator protein McsA
MEEAVEREDYERASEIRDELRQIEETGSSSKVEASDGDGEE